VKLCPSGATAYPCPCPWAQVRAHILTCRVVCSRVRRYFLSVAIFKCTCFRTLQLLAWTRLTFPCAVRRTAPVRPFGPEGFQGWCCACATVIIIDNAWCWTVGYIINVHDDPWRNTEKARLTDGCRARRDFFIIKRATLLAACWSDLRIHH
jgi:hypothetical protein